MLLSMIRQFLLTPFPLHLPFPTPSWMSYWAGVCLILSVLILLDELFPRARLAKWFTPLIPSNTFYRLATPIVFLLTFNIGHALGEPFRDQFVGLAWGACFLASELLLVRIYLLLTRWKTQHAGTKITE